jgi:hypothetical protein
MTFLAILILSVVALCFIGTVRSICVQLSGFWDWMFVIVAAISTYLSFCNTIITHLIKTQ